MERTTNGDIQKAVLLGSFKPCSWNKMKELILLIKNNNIEVISPRDTNLVSIPLPNNPDFYYLQIDLDEVGLTKDDLQGPTTQEILSKLDCRRLQRRVCKAIIQMGKNGYTYASLNENKLGKSTAYELTLAILYGNKVGISEKLFGISLELEPTNMHFLKEIAAQLPIINRQNLKNSLSSFKSIETYGISPEERRKLIKTALTVLLRKEYIPYKRPEKEYYSVQHK